MLRTYLCGDCLRVSLLCTGLNLLLAAPAAAETLNVTIVNPSFEALDTADLATSAASRWSTDGLATFDPQAGQFTGTTGNNVQGEVPFGGQIGNLDLGRVLTQNLGVNAIAGATYNLNHFVGRRRDGATIGTYRVDLLEGANTIATQVVSASTFGFQAAPTITGVATGTGQLTLRFTGLTNQAFIDMPTLTASATKIDVIPVVNASFASPDVGDIATGSPAGWIATGAAVGNGVFDMGAGQFPGTAGNNVIGGASGLDGQVGNIEASGGSLTQNLGVTITPNDTVFMNVAIGNRADAGLDPNYTMQLLLDGVPFASATNPVLPADGEFLVAQLTGVAPSVGQLGIRFTSISGQTFLDDVNVYLVTAAVPEGNSLALFAVCGGLGMVTLGLRRTLVKRKG